MVFASTKITPPLTSGEAEILAAVEGLFIYSSIAKKEISTNSLISILLSIIERDSSNSAGSIIGFMRNVLRKNCDFSKVSTKGKAYAAHEGAKFSEIIPKVRGHLQTDLCRGRESTAWSTFVRKCGTPKPPVGGIRFMDCYLNTEWGEAASSRKPNCYTRIPYRYSICDGDCYDGRTVASQLAELDLFLDSAFHDNDPRLLWSLSTMELAMLSSPNGKIFCVAAPGGDGKGLVATLEKIVIGAENSVRIDPSIFGSDAEFRRSSHFAIARKIYYSSNRDGSGNSLGISGRDLLSASHVISGRIPSRPPRPASGVGRRIGAITEPSLL